MWAYCVWSGFPRKEILGILFMKEWHHWSLLRGRQGIHGFLTTHPCLMAKETREVPVAFYYSAQHWGLKKWGFLGKGPCHVFPWVVPNWQKIILSAVSFHPLPRFQKKPVPVLPEQVSDSSHYTCQPPGRLTNEAVLLSPEHIICHTQFVSHHA